MKSQLEESAAEINLNDASYKKYYPNNVIKILI